MRELREALVAQLLRSAEISEPVAHALRTVPRHLFLPDLDPRETYRDEPIVIKRDEDGFPISSSSQPAIMATMLDQLGVEPGHRVLEIGAGTGYNAALLSLLTGRGGEVVSVDIDRDLVLRAREHLARAGHPRVRVECADGAQGFPGRAPYDRIIATVGVWDLAPAWAAQLAPGGRFVGPLDLRGVQVSAAFERAGDRWVSRSVSPAGFMRIRGAAAGPEHSRQIAGNLTLHLHEPREVGDLLTALTGGPVERARTGVRAGRVDYYAGLSLWLATHESRWCSLIGTSELMPPSPVEIQYARVSAGVAESGSLALLANDPPASELIALGYGPQGARLAGELAAHVTAWQEAGRPATEGMWIEARDLPASGELPAGAMVIDKRDTRLVLGYGGAERA